MGAILSIPIRKNDGNLPQDLLDQIIVGIAHELNNPNAYVRLNATNAKRVLNLMTPIFNEFEKNHPGEKLGPYTPTEIRGKLNQMIESIMQASIRIIAIADKLNQCTSDALSQFTQIDLLSVLNNTVQMQTFLLEPYADVSLENNSGDFTITGHQLQLEQAFAILISNAVDAIRVQHQDKKGKIKISLHSDLQNITIKIEDNGCGIKPDVKEKIFTPYFSTKPQGEGQGIGLAICQAIFTRHGGTISVDSFPGKGTTFEIKLKQTKTEK